MFIHSVDALTISRASNKDGRTVVARAIIFMVDLFKPLNDKLADRPSSYWFAINTEGDYVFVCWRSFVLLKTNHHKGRNSSTNRLESKWLKHQTMVLISHTVHLIFIV